MRGLSSGQLRPFAAVSVDPLRPFLPAQGGWQPRANLPSLTWKACSMDVDDGEVVTTTVATICSDR